MGLVVSLIISFFASGIQTHGFAYHLVVVEVVFYAFYDLVIFMSLAGHKDDIVGLGHHDGRTDGLASIADGDGLLTEFLAVETCLHIVEDVHRLFETWVVAGEDEAIGMDGRLMNHDGTLALVTIATATHHGDDLAFGLCIEDLADGAEHVDQGVVHRESRGWCRAR